MLIGINWVILDKGIVLYYNLVMSEIFVLLIFVIFIELFLFFFFVIYFGVCDDYDD